jgi:hypothetical protein
MGVDGLDARSKKRGGHPIALRTVALSAASNHIRSFISATLTYRYQVINCIGFKPAVVASIVIALQYLQALVRW